MKKIIFTIMFCGVVSAYAGQYPDGIYRGVYISKQNTEVEVQFELKNDIINKINYRTLFYKGHDWLKEEEYKEKNIGYMKVLDDITGKKVQEILPTLYNSKEIETAGATVRKMKIRSAIQYALNLGPFKISE